MKSIHNLNNPFHYTELVIAMALLLLLLTHSVSHAQTYRYAIVVNNKPCGYLYAAKSESGGETTYALNASASFTFLFKTTLEEKIITRTQNDRLITSYYHRKLNGSFQSKHQVQRNDGRYEKTEDSENLPVPFVPVPQSVASLYFQEPLSVRSVFSESHHQNLELRQKGSHQYAVISPSGKKTVYTYHNGQCTKVESQMPLLDIDFILQKNGSIAENTND